MRPWRRKASRRRKAKPLRPASTTIASIRLLPPSEATELSRDDAAQNAAPPVSLTSVSKTFGRFAALRDVTADFLAARLYCIFGDNGAGKSTLLRVVAGLSHATRGTVRIFGGDDLRAAASAFGYMAHAPLLYDELSGMENLRYFARLYGLKDDALARAAMEMVALDPALARRVGDYSQGMRQRLSLARAVLHRPRLLLLDEPFSNVDATSAAHITRLLGEMRDRGVSILVVTHQAAHLEPVADESIWMTAGAVVARAPGVSAATTKARA